MQKLVFVLLFSVPVIANCISINWSSRPDLDKEYLTAYTKGNFYDAKNYCHKLGGILPQIKSELENIFVSQLIPSGQEIWLGAKNSASKAFLWLDESEMTFTNWADHNPFDNSEAIYLHSSGKWQSAFSYSFNADNFVVCERTKNSERRLQELETGELLKKILLKLTALEADVKEIKEILSC